MNSDAFRIQIAAMLAPVVGEPKYNHSAEKYDIDEWGQKLLKLADVLIANGRQRDNKDISTEPNEAATALD